ncbi:hypothetical protein [Sphingobacterium detergens]|uniref:Uncharacterized protein n=1 Tax=Sphingobacterium detergens TaxID=1145106 RepID=A0A420ADV8_SPHD1|nr:hypothetical protein [Sphingobacterium detergens]RKE42556.1 hypothetical protein DFQ12_5468 [Sphingobacterium detergens]
MSEINFLLRDKNRRKFFFKCILIGLPILIGLALLINYMEDSSAAKGTPNDKGGMDYYFRDAVIETAPDVLCKLIPMYPNGKITYYNFSTDQTDNPAGDLFLFTADSFEKVKAFYQEKGKIVDDGTDTFVCDIGGKKITLSKFTTKEDDPVQGENKINISF